MQCQRGCKTKNKHLEGCKDVQCWGCVIMETAFSTCTRCVAQFGRSLEQIQTIWGQLDSLLIAGQSHEIKEHISGTPARGLVINEQVMKVKDSVRDWAVFVHRLIVSESSTNATIRDTSTTSLLAFIYSQRGWLLSHELASDFVTDAVALIKKVSNMINPSGRQHIAIHSATCQAEAETGVCGGALYAVLREQSSKVQSAVYCKKDGSHRLPIGDLVSANEDSKKWLRNDEAATALGVSMQYIKVIAHRESWPTRQPWRQAFYSLESVEKYQKRKAKR
jgi:hypothetical protein